MKAKISIAAALLLITGLFAGGVAFLVRPIESELLAKSPAVAAPTLSSGLGSVAAAVMPSVVSISSLRIVRPAEAPSPHPFQDDPFFGDFFGQFGPPRRQRNLGSGVIVSSNGFILTNNHIVEKARDVTVVLQDRRELEAKVVGTDPMTDIAVLKIDADGLKPARLGNSDQAEVGDFVMAIGSPFGVGMAATAGIISATGRANLNIVDIEDFIQTDAAINPGNSGGALVNMRGEVIGINTAILTAGGGFQGVGFAIPINMARSVMNSLIKFGKVTRGWIGVIVQDVTPVIAEQFKLERPRGVIISDLAPSGPAARAGLKRGDVVLAWNGQEVKDFGHLRNLIAESRPGSQARVTIIREGRQQELAITVAERPVERPEPEARAGLPEPAERIGVRAADLNPEMARQLGVPENTTGALVVEIEVGGAADEAGIQPGDVIQEVNRQPVQNAMELKAALDRIQTPDLLLLVNRRGLTFYASVRR